MTDLSASVCSADQSLQASSGSAVLPLRTATLTAVSAGASASSAAHPTYSPFLYRAPPIPLCRARRSDFRECKACRDRRRRGRWSRHAVDTCTEPARGRAGRSRMLARCLVHLEQFAFHAGAHEEMIALRATGTTSSLSPGTPRARRRPERSDRRSFRRPMASMEQTQGCPCSPFESASFD